LLRPPWRALRRGWRGLTLDAPAAASFAVSFLRAADQAVQVWEQPDVALAPLVAVYVHFDPDGRVAPYVLHAMAELRRHGFCVLFVSNAGRLAPEAVPAVQEVAAGMLVRRNIGYDFGAMREALAHWRLPCPDTEMVLLTNDSVLGPFAPLASMLSRIDFAQADLWAATDSRQRCYHLQSWWLAAGPAALRHPAWQRFWAAVRPVNSREWVIAHYELGLTRALQDAGLRARALFPYDMLLDMASHPPADATALQLRQAAGTRRLLSRGLILNPTVHLWRELLAAGCPYVKRELALRNPAAVVDAAEWRSAVPPDLLRRLAL
jgi:lipopolysaccharide biosynthesis protein